MSSDRDSEHEQNELEGSDQDEFPSDDTDELEHSPKRRRKRIKIRKRVRLKRKSNPKKKIRKILEVIAWTVIIIAFIVTLVVLITELDFNEKNRKKRTFLQPIHPADKYLGIHAGTLTKKASVCYPTEGLQSIPDQKKLF